MVDNDRLVVVDRRSSLLDLPVLSEIDSPSVLCTFQEKEIQRHLFNGEFYSKQSWL